MKGTRMRHQLTLIVAWAATLVVLTEGRAQAHLRDYLVNQPYYTARQGEVELEIYSDYNLRDFDRDSTHSLKQQYELEYGVTHRWQIAYYEVVKWDRTDDWHREALKVETKYRFAEAGKWPVDIALYGEWEAPNGRQATASDVLEGKLILSKDVGPWNLVMNLIAERKINQHDLWGLSYTAGVSYPIRPTARLGLELKETLGNPEGEFGLRTKTHRLQLVPGIYASLTPHVRVLFGPAIGLSKAADDLQLKSLVEIEF